ncbi:MAG: molybdopterin-guanine dinucleotide biosynthesis protein B [Candidatus Aminicenantes bacterium]|nr:molybdopterin-guanine dinucleotide biosynthesis protein B [Candidatus Aminicenantes bacterium]
MGKPRAGRAEVIAFVGRSGTGKTTILRKLVASLRRRGRTVAVIKHCGHGFDFGPRGKDSNLFLRAGACGVALVGPGRMAVLYPLPGRRPRDGKTAAFFGDVDFIFVEGGRTEMDVPKIEVLRRGVAEKARFRQGELRAIVADFPVEAGVSVFEPGQIAEIADFVEAIGRPAAGRAGSRKGGKG